MSSINNNHGMPVKMTPSQEICSRLEDNCIICLDELLGAKKLSDIKEEHLQALYVTQACRHVFHSICYDGYIASKVEERLICPMCRTPDTATESTESWLKERTGQVVEQIKEKNKLKNNNPHSATPRPRNRFFRTRPQARSERGV